MNAILKLCVEAQGADQEDSLSTSPSAGVSSNRYVCSMQPEIMRAAPGSCPKCGMTLMPIRE